ncbi:MAG: hypothetical protein AB7K24_13635 [Gemmataceae bacterium]
MVHIEPHSLWLGHAGDGHDFRRLFDEGIQAVVDLALDEAPVALPRELASFRLPLVDGAGNRGEILFLAVSTTATLLKMKLPTLVRCSNGMSRSPAVAAAALAILQQRPIEEILAEIAAQHSLDLTPVFWMQVKEVLGMFGGRG